MSASPLLLPLSEDKVLAYLDAMPGWSSQDGALQKTFNFGSFREAMGFIVRVAFEAEDMGHHPEWTNVYDSVVVRLRTHTADNRITEKDIDLARRIQHVSWVG